MALLEVKNLGISFGGLRAVDEFSITIEKGQLYGLIGPNGAGKTTIFNMLTGVYKPTDGTIVLDGKNITGKSCIIFKTIFFGKIFQWKFICKNYFLMLGTGNNFSKFLIYFFNFLNISFRIILTFSIMLRH